VKSAAKQRSPVMGIEIIGEVKNDIDFTDDGSVICGEADNREA